MSDLYEKIPQMVDFITSRVLDDEVALMNLKTLRTYSLNSTAAAVWEKIDGKNSIDEIIKSISNDYGMEIDNCKEDILELIIDLSEEKLISLRP